MVRQAFIVALVFIAGLNISCTRVGESRRYGLKVAAPFFMQEIVEMAKAQYETENQANITIVYFKHDSVVAGVFADSSFDLFFAAHSEQPNRRNRNNKLYNSNFSCPFPKSLSLMPIVL